MRPKPDVEFLWRLSEALAGRLPVYSVLLPAACILPFDRRFRPDLDPAGAASIQTCIDAWRKSETRTLTVYPCGAWFVAADDYAPLFAALDTRLEYIPCLVLGRVESAYSREMTGPVDPALLTSRVQPAPSPGCGTSAPCR